MRYNQLRVDDASTAMKIASDTAIQHALSIHSMRGVVMVMEPDFQMGFDEADRRKDVRRDQRSGKQYFIECTPHSWFHQGQSFPCIVAALQRP